MEYEDLCNLSMKSTGIQCLLLDDGLDSDGIAEPFDWHDRFTPAKSKRIVRIEWLAQVCFCFLVSSLACNDQRTDHHAESVEGSD